MRIPTVLAAENHWMIPHDENEVYWASLAFFIVVGLMWKLAGPAVKKAWDARIERITAEVGDAEGERERAAGELQQVQDRVADADSERERILAEARAAAETLERQLVERAHEEAAEAKARAAEDISSAQRQALADLQHEVGELALGAAEQVIAANLDDATQRDLIEGYITSVGSSS